MVFFARALQGNSFFLGRLLLATIILMVPCIISGQPQVFSDTKSYYVLGQAVGEKLGIAPVQSEAVSLRGKGGGAAAEAREVRLAYTVSASRSPYYSLYLYSGSRIGSAWLLVALQSLLTSALIWIVVDLFEVWLFYELTVALLAFTTSAAIFIFFIMPDFASPLGILAFALLVLKWNMLSWARIALLSVTLLIACVFHTSNLLLVCTLMAMTGCLLLIRRHPDVLSRRGAVLVAVICGVSLFANAAFPIFVKKTRGEDIYSPPFVAARIIADGPGLHYLQQNCPKRPVSEWCRYLDKDLTDNNTILWDDSIRSGSFQNADYDSRVRLIKQQPAFVTAVLLERPVELMSAVVENVGRLLVNFRVQEVLEDRSYRWRDPAFSVFTAIVPHRDACRTGQMSCAAKIDYRLANSIIGFFLIISTAAAAVVMAKNRSMVRKWGALLVVILLCLTINAMICGAISGNAERYQSRVMWLVPMISYLICFDALARRRPKSGYFPL